MPSRDINDLTKPMQAKTRAFLALCETHGLDVLIYCTFRSVAEQNELYAIGRSKKGVIVTNARGGQSKHNTREAFDAVPLVNGKAAFNARDLYAQMGKLAESVGLKWAGRWRGNLQELAHFEF